MRLWLQLPDLPEVCWNEQALSLIVALAGKLLCLDDSTSSLSKDQYARVAVEVDAHSPLVPGTIVEPEGVVSPPFWQQFIFKHIHLFCSRCGRLGHRIVGCSFAPMVSGRSCSLSSDVLLQNLSADDDSLPPFARLDFVGVVDLFGSWRTMRLGAPTNLWLPHVRHMTLLNVPVNGGLLHLLRYVLQYLRCVPNRHMARVSRILMTLLWIFYHMDVFSSLPLAVLHIVIHVANTSIPLLAVLFPLFLHHQLLFI